MNDSGYSDDEIKIPVDLVKNLVECPVCFNCPPGRVIQCQQGHHLCETCRNTLVARNMINCPVCRSELTERDTRNLAVENLYSKLNDKNSVFYGRSEPIRSCRIGCCRAQYPAERMYDHVLKDHPDNLIELKMHNYSCSKIFKLKYDFEKLYTYAIHARGLGLFFLNLHIDHIGHLSANLQAANSSQSNNLHYEMGLYIPTVRDRKEHYGMVRDCSVTLKKSFYLDKFERKEFGYYFQNGAINSGQCVNNPFHFSLYIWYH